MNGSIPASPISNHRTSAGFKLIQFSVENTFGFLCAPNLWIGNTDTRWYWELSESIFRFSPVALTMKETSMFHGFNEGLVDFYKEFIFNCDDS
jgi:carboxypeptidase PM20D1